MRCLRNSRTGTGTRILSASDANVRVTAWLESTLGPAVGLLNLHDTWVIDLPRLFIFIRWKILWIFFCWVWEAFTNFKICDKPCINPYWTTMILFTGPHPTNSFQKCSLGKPLQINLSQ